MSKSSVYTFTVENPGDIDWSRICRECEEDGHDAVVVTVKGTELAKVMLSRRFIDTHFANLKVAGYTLGSDAWNGRGVRSSITHGISPWVRRTIDAADVGKVIQEIRAIKERVPLFKVNVHCIEAKARPEREDLTRYEKRAEPAVKWVEVSALSRGDLCRLTEAGPVQMVQSFSPSGRAYVCEFDSVFPTTLSQTHKVIPVTATFTNETE